MHPLVNYVTKILRKQGKKWGGFFDGDAQNNHLSRVELVQNYRSLSKHFKESLREDLYKMTGDAPVFSRSEAIENPEYVNYWLYEGLCGEKNIISGLPFFATSLTWVERDFASIYVLFNPMSDDVFSVCEGSSAQCNSKRIRLKETDYMDLGFTNRVLPMMEKSAVSFRMIGALDLEIAWLCSGKAQIGCYSQVDLSPGLRMLIKETEGTCFEIEYEGTKLTLIGHKRNLIQFMERTQI
jgi:hypothetical protein